METVIRKFGNSKGAIIPAPLLKQLGLDVNDKADVRAEKGCLIIEPQAKKKYSLQELLAKCDETAPMPSELIEWDRMKPVGREI